MSKGCSVVAEVVATISAVVEAGSVVLASCFGLTVVVDVSVVVAAVIILICFLGLSVVPVSSVAVSEVAVLASCFDVSVVALSSVVVADVVVCIFVVLVVSAFTIVCSLLGVVRSVCFVSEPVVIGVMGE